MSRILCAGHVNWDVTLRVSELPDPDGEALIHERSTAGGGSASNTATVLAGLELDVSLLGSVGRDDNADRVTDELETAGVDCSLLQQVPGETTVKYIVVDDDGEVFVFANDGVNEAYRACDLPDDVLEAVDWLHLTSQSPDTASELAKRADGHDITVSFDPGRRLNDREYGELLRTVSYLFLNEREAEQIPAVIQERTNPTVIKHGDGGATYRSGDETVSHGGFDVPTSDTAGAGDAFAAGFLAAMLDKRALSDVLEIANACGALAVQSLGARSAITWERVDQYRGTR